MRNIIAVSAACCFLAGCDLFDSHSRPFVPRPDQLSPDTDVFAKASQRTFLWKEGSQTGKNNSTFPSRTLRIRNDGDTLLNGIPLHRVHFEATDGRALPARVVGAVGFNPTRLLPDSTAIPDPGPALGFPLHPEIGWQDSVTEGDFHFVRELNGLDTLDRPEGWVEAWSFVERVYWDGALTATSTYSMGGSGLLRLYEERPGFNSGSDTATGILWREVTAL